MIVRKYEPNDIEKMICIWNEVVDEGVAFPQEEKLDSVTGQQFFASQSYCGVAADENNNVVGLYILHPNNVGRCGHICNASYAVASSCRGKHIGEMLVTDCRKHRIQDLTVQCRCGEQYPCKTPLRESRLYSVGSNT